MLVVGAKGFAKEVLEVLNELNELDNLVFFDNVNADAPDLLYNKFPVLKTKEEVKHYFLEIDNRFTIGIGNPVLRKKMCDEFLLLGGEYTSTISMNSKIGNFRSQIEKGSNIMAGTIITNDVSIGKGVLINLNCTVGHDSIISSFVEISPGVQISGGCEIGKYSVIGSNATILPNINVGTNVIIAAGAVVTKNIPSNCMVAGVPAEIKKELKPLDVNL